MMSDIDKALKKLPDEQYNILYLRFVDSLDNAHMASELQISDDAARMRVNRAVNSLLNLLGGSRPRKERDYTDAETTNNIGDGAESIGESEDEVTIQELD